MARQAGFDRPILHGLCTMGIACRALISALCPDAPDRLRHLSLRFSQPVYPGETIETEIFNVDAGEIRFRARVVERDVMVLDRGRATLVPAVAPAVTEMEAAACTRQQTPGRRPFFRPDATISGRLWFLCKHIVP